MKVAFFSNYLNHHQLPFSLAMQKYTNGNYTFVATEPISEERLKFGYEEMDHKYPFVLCAYDSAENEAKAMKLALESDIIITGSAPEKYTVERVKKGKITFRYSERPFKQKIPFYRIPRVSASMLLHHTQFKHYPLYMLCASAFTAYDYGRFGAYRDKCFKWGYFPEVKNENLDSLFEKRQQHKKPTILWAGRMLNWKHPEMAILLAQYLKKSGYDFELKIIGDGELENELCCMIRDKGLNDCVKMLGSMSPEKVREHMKKANIFLFTSDFNEGWGAVLNESMNSACAVVASHAIGSVGFLMHQGVNGVIYRNEDQDDLNRKVEKLLDSPNLMEKYGRAAYETIISDWNADTAAKRLLSLAEFLKNGGKGSPYESGPCSAAQRISNKGAETMVLK